ncbi:hypothetical protein F9278_28025 [Streptomyces phaeolivaceus]|uniref:Uncharacterized protein n=1 Tax=Streptomyces phaeolivaceus TaxID=2653200 RepID=A0A5P8K8L6_9ACTN|nr:hypothetical protein [Streptomyces phaeolivaceus]QFQ99360.1 hypothetical protein F9278_28025 [Streptomyces phaeolivaceus]
MSGEPPSGERKTQSARPDDDQMALFTPASEMPPVQVRSAALHPQTELRRLVGELTRRLGLPYPEINNRINREIGVRSRVGANLDVTQQAAAFARSWLEQLRATTAGESERTAPPTSPDSQRSHLDRPTSAPIPPSSGFAPSIQNRPGRERRLPVPRHRPAPTGEQVLQP